MFRGIEPDGLDSLANTVEAEVASVRHESRMAIDLLSRNGRAAAATGIGSAVGGIERWGYDASNNLRWRAAIIRQGQSNDHGSLDPVRARFATEAVFSLGNVDTAYRQWLEQLQAGRQRVDEAFAGITGWLRQGLTDWDVTNGDLHNIWSTLDGLDGEELERVVARLTPRQLRRWIDEMGNHINGFSRAEKRQVFTMLAENASGQSLGMIHDAILAVGNTEANAVDFGIAVQSHSPDDAIVAFVTYVVARDLAGQPYSGIAPALAAGGVDEPAAIDSLLRAVLTTDGALGYIAMDSLAAAHIEEAGDTCFRIDPLESLTTTMSRGGDPALKALGFAGLVGIARHQAIPLRGDEGRVTGKPEEAEFELLGAATRVLASDLNAIITNLATTVDRDGSITSAYLYRLVDQDRIGDLGRLVDDLRGGNGVDEVLFSDPGADSDYPYPHAQNLAFFAAGLNNALQQYATDAKGDIDTITGIAAAVGLLAIPLARGLAYLNALIEGGVGLVADGVADGTKESIDNRLAQLVYTVETALQPQLPLQTSPDDMAKALLQWRDRYDIISGSKPSH